METDKDESHLTKLFYFQKGQEKKKELLNQCKNGCYSRER